MKTFSALVVKGLSIMFHTFSCRSSHQQVFLKPYKEIIFCNVPRFKSAAVIKATLSLAFFRDFVYKIWWLIGDQKNTNLADHLLWLLPNFRCHMKKGSFRDHFPKDLSLKLRKDENIKRIQLLLVLILLNWISFTFFPTLLHFMIFHFLKISKRKIY